MPRWIRTLRSPVSTAVFFVTWIVSMPAQQTRRAEGDDRQFQQAMRAMERGELTSAKNFLLRLNVTHPHNFAIEESLGEIFADENDWQGSAHWIERAVHDQNPPSAQVLSNLGTAYWKTGHPQAAKEVLEKSALLAPDNAQTESLLGDVEEALGHYDLAARHLLRAAELDPTEEHFNFAGLEFLRHWSFDPAIRTFTAALDRYPQSAVLHFGLAVALYGAQHYDKAVPLFANLLHEFPDHRAYAKLFGQSCAALVEVETPRCSEFVTYAETHEADAELLTLAAVTLMHSQTSSEDQQHAERLLERALSKSPDFPEANYQMGLLQQHRTNWKGSVPYLRVAIRARAAYAQAHYRLGLALSHLGQKEEANAEMKFQQQLSESQNAEMDRRLNEIRTIVVSDQPQK